MGDAASRTGETRWTVEELSGGTASVVGERGGLRYVARRLLPPAVAVGGAVRVRTEDAGAGVRVVHLHLDEAAAAELSAKVRRALGGLRRGRGA
jgi:hypothetical protein